MPFFVLVYSFLEIFIKILVNFTDFLYNITKTREGVIPVPVYDCERIDLYG